MGTSANKKAIVLLSGGLDSTTTLAIAQSEGYTPYAITFKYGQRHDAEIAAARRVAAQFDVANHVIANIDLRMFGGSALTADIDVPKGRAIDEMSEGIPITYVPARNTIFLSLALAWAETLEISDLFLGVNALDYSGYPDCRPEYIAAYETLANLATKAGVEGRPMQIETPLMHLSKAQIIQQGVALGLDYGLTVSCYQADENGNACGKCDSCRLRSQGFEDALVKDPTNYQ